jgi:putative hemolysin
MARWLMDCRAMSGHPWRLGLATEPHEREEVYRLRYDVFFREQGYGSPDALREDGRDVDSFDEWCDHLILYDCERERMIGAYRAIPGAEAIRRGGLYGNREFDLNPLAPIASQILQGGRTCVAAEYRSGLALQYLSYGMELLLREYGARYFLGAETFRVDSLDTLNTIYSYVRQFGTDPDWFVPAQPTCQVAGLCVVPVTSADERRLPNIIRMDLRMGFLACSPPAWDPEFAAYDLMMLGRRDQLTRVYHAFIQRIERNVPT